MTTRDLIEKRIHELGTQNMTGQFSEENALRVLRLLEQALVASSFSPIDENGKCEDSTHETLPPVVEATQASDYQEKISSYAGYPTYISEAFQKALAEKDRAVCISRFVNINVWLPDSGKYNTPEFLWAVAATLYHAFPEIFVPNDLDREMNNDQSSWSKPYLEKQLDYLKHNFSIARVGHAIDVYAYIVRNSQKIQTQAPPFVPAPEESDSNSRSPQKKCAYIMVIVLIACIACIGIGIGIRCCCGTKKDSQGDNHQKQPDTMLESSSMNVGNKTGQYGTGPKGDSAKSTSSQKPDATTSPVAEKEKNADHKPIEPQEGVNGDGQ